MLKVKQVIITEHDLAKLCKQAGITIAELGKRLGKSRATIYKMHQGKIWASQDNWSNICEILDYARSKK